MRDKWEEGGEEQSTRKEDKEGQVGTWLHLTARKPQKLI